MIALFWESGGTCRSRGPQKSLICWGALNDAEHQSLRPCYRTREQSDIGQCNLVTERDVIILFAPLYPCYTLAIPLG